ncbi:hypothetical protein [Mycolicibacterium sp. 050158]|uniref:hypothetical protein n=1 Tax=Mycolicibacterium sp. 050158 TaxID=3090602 RepID=UPI00299E47F7|nr:hypothetical protein [Mycolicibacterium sp. 050158]MDX1890119.1 hypothetical protein [Mycolicibacterium sp. 050158]
MTLTLPPQQPQPDPRGWLVFTALLPDDLQRAEDSTQHADFHPVGVKWSTDYDAAIDVAVDYFTRPATDAERTLLTALGYAVPADLATRVSFPSPLVRRRRWLALETQQENRSA